MKHNVNALCKFVILNYFKHQQACFMHNHKLTTASMSDVLLFKLYIYCVNLKSHGFQEIFYLLLQIILYVSYIIFPIMILKPTPEMPSLEQAHWPGNGSSILNQ